MRQPKLATVKVVAVVTAKKMVAVAEAANAKSTTKGEKCSEHWQQFLDVGFDCEKCSDLNGYMIERSIMNRINEMDLINLNSSHLKSIHTM